MSAEPGSPARAKAGDEWRPAKQPRQPVLPPAADVSGSSPSRPARAVARRPGAPWLAVGTVCVGAFMGQLDASIVTLALPTLQRTFHASLGAVTWIGLSYLLVLVAMVTAVGRVADMAGRKLLYTYGFGVFILGSALCGLVPSLAALAGFRVLQAVGAAMLQANSVAIVAAMLIALALGRPGQLTMITGLAVAGAGLGLFTPPNNAAIMAAAPNANRAWRAACST